MRGRRWQPLMYTSACKYLLTNLHYMREIFTRISLWAKEGNLNHFVGILLMTEDIPYRKTNKKGAPLLNLFYQQIVCTPCFHLTNLHTSQLFTFPERKMFASDTCIAVQASKRSVNCIACVGIEIFFTDFCR